MYDSNRVPVNIFSVRIDRTCSRRNGPGGRRATGNHQTHMAVTSQKDTGIAHSEKRLWVVFFFFFAYSGAALVGFYSFYKFKKHFLAIRTGLNAGKLTVGKIYAGLLILESWKSTKFGQVEPTNPQVIYYCVFVYKIILMKKLYKK